MKKVVLLTALLFLLLTQNLMAQDPNAPVERDQAIAVWLTGGSVMYQNTDIGLWVGYRRPYNDAMDTEIGLALDWRKWNEGDSKDDTQSDWAVGAYAAVHMLELIDIPMPIELPGSPDQLLGAPFFGIEYVVDVDQEGSALSPFTGIRFLDVFAVLYKYEIVYGERVPNNGEIGISANFKF